MLNGVLMTVKKPTETAPPADAKGNPTETAPEAKRRRGAPAKNTNRATTGLRSDRDISGEPWGKARCPGCGASLAGPIGNALKEARRKEWTDRRRATRRQAREILKARGLTNDEEAKMAAAGLVRMAALADRLDHELRGGLKTKGGLREEVNASVAATRAAGGELLKILDRAEVIRGGRISTVKEAEATLARVRQEHPSLFNVVYRVGLPGHPDAEIAVPGQGGAQLPPPTLPEVESEDTGTQPAEDYAESAARDAEGGNGEQPGSVTDYHNEPQPEPVEPMSLRDVIYEAGGAARFRGWDD